MMNNKSKKPALLFDLGGVIMDIRRENCVASMRRLGMEHPEEFLGDYGQKGPFLLLEKGEITPEEFRRQLRPYLNAGVTDDQIDAAFNDFLVGIPVERLRHLEALHRDHHIYMLSNTNKIMWDSKIAEEFRKDGHDRDYYFDGCVASFAMKSYKPDPHIFQATLDRFGLEAGDVIFFDDSQANCEAAAQLGFRTVWVAPGSEFYDMVPQQPQEDKQP